MRHIDGFNTAPKVFQRPYVFDYPSKRIGKALVGMIGLSIISLLTLSFVNTEDALMEDSMA